LGGQTDVAVTCDAAGADGTTTCVGDFDGDTFDETATCAGVDSTSTLPFECETVV
jgi:hypothetical protein